MDAATLKRKYNLTPVKFEQMLAACDHTCPLCRKRYKDRTRPPCVDHDHRTGLVRGLICGPCNDAIGRRNDDAGWFSRVGKYLDSPPAPGVIGEVYVPRSLGAANLYEREHPERFT